MTYTIPLIKITTLTIVAFSILSFGVITTVKGQSSQDSLDIQENIHVSDAKLWSFIQAQEAIRNVQNKYRRAAENPEGETAKSLQRGIGEELVRAIKAHNLTVDEYNTILAETQKANSNTAKRYNDMISRK